MAGLSKLSPSPARIRRTVQTDPLPVARLAQRAKTGFPCPVARPRSPEQSGTMTKRVRYPGRLGKPTAKRLSLAAALREQGGEADAWRNGE